MDRAMIKIFLPLLLCLGGAAAAGDAVPAKPGMEAYYSAYNKAVDAHLHSRLGEACRLYARAAAEAARLKGARWEYGRAITMLAVASHTRGNYRQAGKYYLKSVAYCRKYKLPELYVAVSGLGRLYLDRTLPLEAGPLLKEACEKQYDDASDSVYAIADSFSSMGRLNEQLGNMEKADVYYLTAVKLYKDAETSFAFKVLDAEQMDSYPIILYRIGAFYEKLGRAEQAAGYYARALKAFANWTGLEDRPALNARVLDYRGRTLKAVGRDAEAEADLKEAARLYALVRPAGKRT